MAMSRSQTLIHPTLRFASAAIALGLCAVVLKAGGADSILERSYSRALGGVNATWTSDHARNIWLSSAPAPTAKPPSVPLPGALGIGDRISVKSAQGSHVVIEVTALEEVEGAGMGLAGTRFQIVSGRLPEGGDTVRFIFSVEQPATAPLAPQPGRTL
jgi:hypothetical protein